MEQVQRINRCKLTAKVVMEAGQIMPMVVSSNLSNSRWDTAVVAEVMAHSKDIRNLILVMKATNSLQITRRRQ